MEFALGSTMMIDSTNNVLQTGTWYHLTFWYDWASKNRKVYINGVESPATSGGTSTTGFLATSGVICLGSWTGGSNFTGMVDDFQIYQKALSDAEIQNIMKGLSDKSLAVNVSPADGATDVPRDATLSWTAGPVSRHARRVLRDRVRRREHRLPDRRRRACWPARARPTPPSIRPACSPTARPTTGGSMRSTRAPDNTIFKGDVWSFTAEPYGYPVTTVDGHGLQRPARHGPGEDHRRLRPDRATCTAPSRRTMWLSTRRAAELDPVRVRQGLQAARAEGLELQPADRELPRLRRQERHDRVLHRRHDLDAAGQRAGVRPGDRHAGLRRQHHGQLRRRRGQVRQADDHQPTGAAWHRRPA